VTKTSADTIIAVAGLGLLGRGIVACLLSRGFRVIAFDANANVETRAATSQHIARGLNELVERGGFDAALTKEWRRRYVEAAGLDAFAGADSVIESIFEDLDAKRQLFDAIEAVVKPTTPIASNTSALPISTLQANRKHPSRFVGLHWAEPCQLTRFLEVVRGEQTDDATVDAALALAHAAGKDPSLVQKDVEGFIVNRLSYAMYREAFWLLENGVADVATIDRAFVNALSVWANVAGPFRWMDLTGVPAYAAVMKRLFPQLSCSTEVPKAIRNIIDRGGRGIADGDGFYRYTPAEAERWERVLRENVWRVRAMQDELLSRGPAEPEVRP
jgi:3-hydroxybutyryl-CoA dehydrogenase